MPWDCKACNTYVEEDNVSECPQCGEEKLSWTMAADKTRTFTVAAKKVHYLFGAEREPLSASEASYPNEQGWQSAERVVAVPKSQALLWKDKVPPSEQVLVVKPLLSAKANFNIDVTVELAAGRPIKQSFAYKGYAVGYEAEGKKWTKRFPFLFVYGAADALPDGFSLPGVQIIDITEAATELGHAPQISIKTSEDKRKRVFPVDRLEKGWVQRLECRQLVFNHDSYLGLPEGLSVLLLVLTHSYETKRPLLLCGHTDASGSETYNETLAENRCLNVMHLLEGNRMAWAKSSLENYQNLKTTNKRAPDTKYLKAWLQKVPSTYQTRAAWEGVFDEYEEALRGELANDAAGPTLEDLRSALVWVDPNRKMVACGEDYLKVNPKAYMSEEDLKILENWDATTTTPTQKENVGQMLKVETNRRIEFMWFESDRLPWEASAAPETDVAARQAVYGAGGWQTWDYQSSDGPFTFDQIACPPVLAIRPPPGDVVFVIDISQSMDSFFSGSSGKTRMQVLKEQLEACLTALSPPTRKFSMLKFGTTAEDNFFWRVKGDDGRFLPAKTMHLATPANKAKAIAWVRTLTTAGSTNTYRALEQALSVPGAEALVFLSDGMPTKSTTLGPNGETVVATIDELKILDEVEGWNPGNKVRIDTYGFQAVPKSQTKARGKSAQDQIAALYKVELRNAAAMTDVKLHKSVALKAVAANASAKKVDGRSDWTSMQVREALLGWFLELLKDQNRGKFVNLNVMVAP